MFVLHDQGPRDCYRSPVCVTCPASPHKKTCGLSVSGLHVIGEVNLQRTEEEEEEGGRLDLVLDGDVDVGAVKLRVETARLDKVEVEAAASVAIITMGRRGERDEMGRVRAGAVGHPVAGTWL